jgi:hypothetical protein
MPNETAYWRLCIAAGNEAVTGAHFGGEMIAGRARRD